MLTPDPGWYAPPKKKKTPTWTEADVAASLAANPYASRGGYEGVGSTYGLPAAAAATATPMTSRFGALKVGGFDPDYEALIQGDPTRLAGVADVDEYRGRLDDARRSAIRRAVINAGIKPVGVLGDLDEATLAATEANQFSSAAQLEQQRSRGQADLEANLAGRGILQSGALEGGSQRVQQGYEGGLYSTTQQLLDLIGQVEGSTGEKKAELQQRIIQLRADAAARVAADPRFQPIGATDAVLDPSSGLYVTPDGRWYTSDGTRTTAPAAGAAGAAGAAPAGASTALAAPSGSAPSASQLISEGVPATIARRVAREASYGLDF